MAKNKARKQPAYERKESEFTKPRYFNKFKPQSDSQKAYCDMIDNNDVIICVGPAGTGKTYVAVSKAVEYIQAGKIERIVICRPAVEAGEKLGFLPGTFEEKIDPYMRPIWDALHDLLGFQEVENMVNKNQIETTAIAYMRGRTLKNSFIIMDEAQNATNVQLKMVLTRMGTNSKMIVTGDTSQIDLHPKQGSGLLTAMRILENVPGVCIFNFSGAKIIRHEVVGRIVDAYAKQEESN